MISEETLAAYRSTNYRVHAPTNFTLRVGERSSELAALHGKAGVSASAFISAYNPWSEALADDVNRARHAAFERELRDAGMVAIEGMGQHPTNGWPGEPSYLVLGVSLEAARAMGDRLEQNAILWMDEDAVPQLVLLR